MKFKTGLWFFIGFIVLSGLRLHSQETFVRSEVTETISGKKFYLHQVEKGQTLYTIARNYNVQVDEILESNAEIGENIKPGDIILIPAIQQQEPYGMNIRRVAKGETLFSLAKEYRVTIDEILAANDGLPDGLIVDTIIKIPIFDRTETPSLQQSDNQAQGSAGIPATAVRQETQKQPVQQEKPEKNYFEFQSRDNETVFELAIRYRISVDTIMAFNPGINEQLFHNQIIKIPFSPIERDYITHNIQQRITIRRLARLYGLDADQIKKINPFISRQLQEGQTIKIPLPRLKDDEESPDSKLPGEDKSKLPAHDLTQKDFCNQLNDQGTYNIALLIPFFLSELRENPDSISDPDSQHYGSGFIKSYLFIQFYEGLLLAVDSLRQLGLNAEIHVFNVEDNIAQAKRTIDDPLLKNMHLIIGPFYSSSFKIVADFAYKHKIPIVNPLTPRSDVLTGNPFVFKVLPAEDRMLSALTEFLNQKHKSSQIFIARHNAYRDEQMINNLKSALEDDLSLNERSFTNIYQEIIYSPDSLNKFRLQASPTKENVIIIYSDNKVFLLDVMRKLNQLREQFNITVIGLPNWMDLEGLDYHHMNNLNAHVIATEFADYNNPQVKNFVSKFRENYHAEPEKYAFKGFDAGIFFLSAMMKYGAHFNECIPYYKIPLLQESLKFSAVDGNGFENQDWKVLRLKDYKFSEIILH